MDCKEIQAMMIDYLDRGVGAEGAAAMRAHLLGCESCRKEVEEMRELLSVMGEQELRQPGPGLRENFQVMLQSELNMETADDLLGRTRDGKGEHAGAKKGIGWMGARGIGWMGAKGFGWTGAKGIGWMAAAACILLFGGIWIGAMVGSRKTSNVPEQLGAMQKEIREMKEAMMFSLIDDESASQRIKAVGYAEEMSNPDQRVIQALVGTLNHDKNVNVRLAALYSLATFADNRSVRDSLVSSLAKQTEPLIQVMLITLLAERKDNRAIGPIRDIISNKNTLPAVKDAAQKSLKTL